MPGFELIGKEEHNELNHLMTSSSILFRHGFDGLRNGVYKVRDFEKAFAEKMGSNNALAVTSGTAALLVALKAFGIGRGDEVITQAFTFVATVEAIVESGASPVIAEIDHSLNIAPGLIEKLITPATKAIIVVHMLGIPVDMEKVNDIAKKAMLETATIAIITGKIKLVLPFLLVIRLVFLVRFFPMSTSLEIRYLIIIVYNCKILQLLFFNNCLHVGVK